LASGLPFIFRVPSTGINAALPPQPAVSVSAVQTAKMSAALRRLTDMERAAFL
jgi:hypothetical protein